MRQGGDTGVDIVHLSFRMTFLCLCERVWYELITDPQIICTDAMPYSKVTSCGRYSSYFL